MQKLHTAQSNSRFSAVTFSLAILTSLLMAAFAFVAPSVSLASDHRESPTADQNPPGDITDVFAFLDPNDPSKVVLIMNVNPFSVPAETPTYRYSPNFLYQFKIAGGAQAIETSVIQAIFADVPTTTCASGQTVKIYGPTAPSATGAVNSVVNIQPTISGCTGGTITQGNFQLFTGLRDDPFVTDVGQLNRILQNKQDVFRDFPGFALGALRGRPVNSSNTSGVDGFGGFNVSTIAVEFPKSQIQGSGFLGAAGLVGVWGTVSQPVVTSSGRSPSQPPTGTSGPQYTQFQRVGQQLFKTVFVPSTMRESFNASLPQNDSTAYASLIPNALTTKDTDTTNNTIAGRAALLTALGFTDASGANAGKGHGAPLLLPGTFANTNVNLLRVALLPDVERLNLNLIPTGVLPGAAAVGGNGDPQLALGVYGLQNGRRPADTVTDILLQFARQLADVNFPTSLGVPGSGPARAGALDFATDRRVVAVLEGTNWIKADAQVGNVSGNASPYGGNDEPLLSTFPFLAAPQPLPGETGTVGFPTQLAQKSGAH